MMARRYRLRVLRDPDPDLSWVEQSREEYEKNRVVGSDGEPVSYEDFRATYGDPRRHVTLALELYEECRCCHEFQCVDALWGIDYVDWKPWPKTGDFSSPEQIEEKYMRELAREMIAAREEAE